MLGEVGRRECYNLNNRSAEGGKTAMELERCSLRFDVFESQHKSQVLESWEWLQFKYWVPSKFQALHFSTEKYDLEEVRRP